MRITDIFKLDREYQQLRADMILGKVHSVEFVRQFAPGQGPNPLPALLATQSTQTKSKPIKQEK